MNTNNRGKLQRREQRRRLGRKSKKTFLVQNVIMKMGHFGMDLMGEVAATPVGPIYSDYIGLFFSEITRFTISPMVEKP